MSSSGMESKGWYKPSAELLERLGPNGDKSERGGYAREWIYGIPWARAGGRDLQDNTMVMFPRRPAAHDTHEPAMNSSY